MFEIPVSKTFFVFLLAFFGASGLDKAVTTSNPQRMWDPEKGSILGHDLQAQNYENLTITNKTVQIGSSSFLNCRVKNAADKKVSWIRRRDNHILTSGLLTYSRDNRFSVMKAEGTDDWILQIRFTQKRDEGRYECQVSTKTGRYGHVVNLFVVVPEATISGAPELHVQSGSTINLVCLITDSITPPRFFSWYHNSKIIYYDQSRGRINILTDLENITPTSKLTVTDAAFDDSGNYTCFPSNTNPASINIFVSKVTTLNPQQMWDPEKDSILGYDVQAQNYENLTITNKTVQIGSSSFLNCRVKTAANEEVSWIRRRDNHILTIDKYTYINDDRFSVTKAKGTDDWILHIRFTQKRDEGRYECQVSNKTSKYGHVVNLFVVVPEATISGAPELHVQSGSTINLVCLITDSITPPRFFSWYHNSKMIYYDQSRGRINILTDLENITPTSKLTVTDAAFDDSGNYTCFPSNTKPASINVFVSEGAN